MSAPSSGGYEHADARPKAIVLAVIFLLGAIVTAFLVSSWLERGFTGDARRDDLEPHPMSGTRRGPTEALLQTNPPDDYFRWSTRQRELEETYGWIDREAGVVRLPVERAMEILVTRPAAEDGR